jgi:hypothetical protein
MDPIVSFLILPDVTAFGSRSAVPMVAAAYDVPPRATTNAVTETAIEGLGRLRSFMRVPFGRGDAELRVLRDHPPRGLRRSA